MRSSSLSPTMGSGALSGAMYNLAIGLTLLWGLGLNAYMIEVVPFETLKAIPTLWFMIGYFACAFLGIYLNVSSTNPGISFVGYNLVVIPMGLVVCMALPSADPVAIQMAAIQTGMVVVLMTLFGTFFPKLSLSFGPFLFVALIGLIIAQLVSIFIFKSNPAILDIIGVAIFSGYIAYDWARAQSLQKTLDNAIDAACSLYMDIINLFMRLLSLNSRD